MLRCFEAYQNNIIRANLLESESEDKHRFSEQEKSLLTFESTTLINQHVKKMMKSKCDLNTYHGGIADRIAIMAKSSVNLGTQKGYFSIGSTMASKFPHLGNRV